MKAKIPQNWSITGFFGGIGGHLHNIGIVIQRTYSTPVNNIYNPLQPNLEVSRKLQLNSSQVDTASNVHQQADVDIEKIIEFLRKFCEITNEEMWKSTLGMLSFHPNENIFDTSLNKQKVRLSMNNQLAEVGYLLQLISVVKSCNSDNIATACLQAVIAYVENIVSNPGDGKRKQIRVGNGYFRSRIIAAVGGIELLCFGPAGL